MKVALILSFDHPELSKQEALSCLKAEGIKVREFYLKNRVLIADVEANWGKLKPAFERSATIKEAIEVLQIITQFEEIDFKELLKKLIHLKTFGVRASRFDGELNSREVEREIGKRILMLNPKLRVDLTHPDVWVRAISLGDKLIVGFSKHRRVKKFIERSPSKRPFLLASTLKPKLALTLVNLSEVNSGKILLDPFCGAGSILIEAGLLNAYVIGCDVFKKHIYGCKKNLKWLNINVLGLIRCDSTRLPIRRADSVVTDPPYGIEAPLAGKSLNEIYSLFLKNSREVLKQNSKIVFMHPKKLSLKNPNEYGFRENFSTEIPVHGSLTRKIRVWSKI